MKIIIAEKPSVAKSIAAVVGANNKKEGYIEGNGYAVTWAFGHLVGLAMPEHYGIEGFKRENLPILPTEFKLLPRQVKEGKEYKNDPDVMKQLKVIKSCSVVGTKLLSLPMPDEIIQSERLKPPVVRFLAVHGS